MKLFRQGITGYQRIVLLSIAILSAISGLVFYRETFPFVQQLDLRLKDARLMVCGLHTPTAPVTIIAIDNKSIKELGRWPWSRELTARLFDAAARQGAGVIALDMVFSEVQGSAPDKKLASSISAAGNVVMGYFFRDELQQRDPRALEQLSKAKIAFLKLAPGVTSVPVPTYDQVDVNIASVGAGAADFGFFNQLADTDGLYRSVPLLMLFQGDVYPSLALAAVSRFLGEQVQVTIEQFGVSKVSVGAISIPTDEQGKLSLAYYGPGGTMHTVSAADVLAGRLPAGALKGRLIFVGVTETGIADVRATPLAPAYPGVEMHATLAANVLEQRFLTRDSRTMTIEIGAMLALPLLLAFFQIAVSGPLYGFLVFILSVSGYIGGNFHLFDKYHFDLSLAYPLLPLALTYVCGECYRNLVVERKGRHLKKAFSTYLSADLVSEIARNPDLLKLGGETRVISILFSDIRGFTTLSEKLTPEELVALLNQYLSPMTRIVMEERGTLDKFIGDAIMAFFNAPLEVPDHPERACRCALRMIEGLAVLNDQLTIKSVPVLEIGIGIHTGEAVVGNMGADIRFDYTAIGDSVNLASRLEGLTKFYGVAVIVSDATRKQVGSEFNFRELDLVRVKGKHEPVAVFELITKQSGLYDSFAEGMRLYRERDFASALGIFESLSKYNDTVSNLYVERCNAFLSNPPDAGWDGVYVALSK